jgi:hypothetical protein
MASSRRQLGPAQVRAALMPRLRARGGGVGAGHHAPTRAPGRRRTRLGTRKVADHAPSQHHHHPIGQRHQLVEVRRQEQHPSPGGGGPAQALVDGGGATRSTPRVG